MQPNHYLRILKNSQGRYVAIVYPLHHLVSPRHLHKVLGIQRLSRSAGMSIKKADQEFVLKHGLVTSTGSLSLYVCSTIQHTGDLPVLEYGTDRHFKLGAKLLSAAKTKSLSRPNPVPHPCDCLPDIQSLREFEDLACEIPPIRESFEDLINLALSDTSEIAALLPLIESDFDLSCQRGVLLSHPDITYVSALKNTLIASFRIYIHELSEDLGLHHDIFELFIKSSIKVSDTAFHHYLALNHSTLHLEDCSPPVNPLTFFVAGLFSHFHHIALLYLEPSKANLIRTLALSNHPVDEASIECGILSFQLREAFAFLPNIINLPREVSYLLTYLCPMSDADMAIIAHDEYRLSSLRVATLLAQTMADMYQRKQIPIPAPYVDPRVLSITQKA